MENSNEKFGSAKECLDNFQRIMEMLKPYLPKAPKYEPKPERRWEIQNPHTFPPMPEPRQGVCCSLDYSLG